MKHLVAALLALSLLLNGSAISAAIPELPEDSYRSTRAAPEQPQAIAAFPAVTTPDWIVQDMIAQVRQETVRQYTGDLSGEWEVIIRGQPYTIITRNTTSGTPIERATQFTGDHLAANGLSIEYHRWGKSGTPPNVIGTLTGESRPADIYMITAHLDNMPSTAPAPGADDNASGSVAVMVASDILADHRWACTLRFALWTGEEQGLLGSNSYAQRASRDGDKILGVLNFDMIGWNTLGSTGDIDLHADSKRPATVELANQLASVVTVYGLDLVPQVRADGTGASDHASFWDAGYTAILGIEDYYPTTANDFNPYYHTPNDKLAKLDLGYYTEFVRAAVAGTVHMAACRVPGPEVTSGYNSGEVQLQWQWNTDDTAYEVHRDIEPYFNPAEATLIATVTPMLPNPVVYRDGASGAGDPGENHFYVVRAMKDGRGAVSNRTGEFDFGLTPGN